VSTADIFARFGPVIRGEAESRSLKAEAAATIARLELRALSPSR